MKRCALRGTLRCTPVYLMFLMAALMVRPGQTVAAPTIVEPAAAGGRVNIPVSVASPGKGFLSLALYDVGGVLVRTLLYALPVEEGQSSVAWDGTTDLGKPAGPGTYTARGIFFTQAPSLRLQMIVGKSGNPPWRTPDGKGDWGGNLGFPSSIVSNGKSLVMGYAAVEDNQITGIQQMDQDGNIQTRYFSFYPWDTRMAAAMDDRNYYLGILNVGKKQIEIAEYKPGEPRGKILVAVPTQPHEDVTETRWRGRFEAWLDGLALTPDTLFASVGADNSLFIIDRATAQIRQRITLPAPHGLAVSQGHVLVVSGRKVLRLALDGHTEATVVDEGVLQAPSALAVDGAGNCYVSDSGTPTVLGANGNAGSRQVLVFSPTGKLLRKIGKRGGTPREGRFNQNGLGNVTSLCIGPGDKTLWVNDIATGFPRTSRWSLDGRLERQWFGRKLSLYSDVLNPARPNELIYVSNAFADEPGISAYAMDLATKTWQPSWHYDTTWADMYQEDVLLSFKHGGNPLTGPRGPDARWPVFDYNSRSFVSYKGRNYFMNAGGNGDCPVFLYSSDHKPKPAALVGSHRSERRADGKIESFYDQGPNNWFTWADRNSDGKMAADEIILTENPPLLANTPRLNEARLDANLNVVMKRYVNNKGQVSLVDSILPLKDLLPNGAPVYDWSQLRDRVPLQAPDLTGGDGTKQVRVYQMPLPLETADATYSLVEPEATQRLNLPGIDGPGWWASRNWRTKVARFDKQTGKPLWGVGRRAPARAERGQMYHPAWLAGVAGGALFVTDTLGPIWVWSTDGLFLGHIYHDFGAGIQDDQVLYGETQATTIYTDPRTGRIYSIANDTGAHIHEVILPKLTPVQAGSVTLSAAQTAQAQPWDPDGIAPTEHPTYEAHFTAQSPQVDGDLGGADRDLWWRLPDGRPRPEMLILLDGQRLAAVRVLYDRQNLYLGYDVSAPNGPLNAGSELPYGPFVSGAYVDFVVGPNWQGPRAEVRDGDLRVILARVSERAGTGDFQQGFWQKKADGAKPQTVTSPAASVHFDQIMTVPGLQMAYKVDEKDARTGLIHYSVEVAVPLTSLGLGNVTGKSIGFDASVGVANTEGNRRERAAHWGGMSEAVVVDRPGSSRLQPDTWGTLTFVPQP